MGDIELTCKALWACGYRTHIKERNGTEWVTAVKGLNVRYEHWHPLTNINQAMQLLESRQDLCLTATSRGVTVTVLPKGTGFEGYGDSLIDAMCRAIVTACASLEPVR